MISVVLRSNFILRKSHLNSLTLDTLVYNDQIKALIKFLGFRKFLYSVSEEFCIRKRSFLLLEPKELLYTIISKIYSDV